MVFLVLVSAFSPIGDLTTFTRDCRTRNSIVSGLSSITATVRANLDPSAKGRIHLGFRIDWYSLLT
jgi:hypothetical protein